MPTWNPRANDLFLKALEMGPASERQEYLDRACVGDAPLRAEVEALLAASAQAGSFLDSPAPRQVATVDELPVREKPGIVVGPYRLLEQIGEGGFGVVFLAEQTQPVRRQVALKVLKPGMDTRQVVARFEAERQALALMDHPNIARVFDGGETASGRPYFVMELVKGAAFTEFCDHNRLSVRERLSLFIDVCSAVQHAHQKGIIHRDLKPSNILVTLHDDKAVVKVIDFGVAKAIGQQLTDKTLFTGFAQMIGTPMYMSPEQAGMSGLDMDTRSDIYSLGVLLYELLTGATPFDKGRMRTAGYDEMRRIIREEEPARPSTRMSTVGQAADTASANRRSDPKHLCRLLRGELDWIVMKALEKDRNRRYDTASAFAADVRRYLNDEPVQACPPSAAYRLRKFARRNKGPVLAASLISLALIAGMLGTTVGLIRAVKAREAEEEQRELAEANEQKALTAAAAETIAKQAAEAREAESDAVIDFLENKVLAAAGLEGEQGGLGREVTLRKAVEAALPFVETSFPKQPIIEARLRMTLGIAYFNLGEAAKAAEQFQKASTLNRQYLGPDNQNTLRGMRNLVNCYQALARKDDALQLGEETLAVCKAKFGLDHPDTIMCMATLAHSYGNSGRHGDALKLREEALKLSTARLGPDHPDTLLLISGLADSYDAFRRHADALGLREKTLALCKAKIGSDHRLTIAAMANLSDSYSRLGRYADSLKLREETLALGKAKLGPDHPETIKVMHNLTLSYARYGRHAEALQLSEETLALSKGRLGHDHPSTITRMYSLAARYAHAGRHGEVLTLHEQALALRKGKLGPDHPLTLESMWGVAVSLNHLNRSAEALPLIDECVRLARGKSIDRNVIRGMMMARAEHFQKAKDAAGCRATAEMWEQFQRTDADSLFHAACFRAVTATVVVQDPKTPAGDASRLAREEADRAMAWLKQAVAAGYGNAQQLKKDPDLNALRDREDFKKLLAELESKRK